MVDGVDMERGSVVAGGRGYFLKVNVRFLIICSQVYSTHTATSRYVDNQSVLSCRSLYVEGSTLFFLSSVSFYYIFQQENILTGTIGVHGTGLNKSCIENA